MRVDPVSARYTEALFSLARKKGTLESVRADVERISGEVKSERVVRFLTNPRLSSEQRLKSFEPLIKGLTPLTANFVRLLFEKRREEVLLQLGNSFRQRLLQEAGAVEGVVESARPLDGSQIDSLAADLSTRLGKRVYLENQVRPELSGGFRVLVGSRMIDQTIEGRLERMRRAMLDAPLASAAQ